MTNDLRKRIAAVLGWSVEDTRGFGLSTLTELVRGKDATLHVELRKLLQTGEHLFGPRRKGRSPSQV